jgi:Domain of unknown function (DUF4129)
VRSRSNIVASIVLIVLTMLVMRPAANEITPQEITRAIDTVKKDPNLSPERTIKTLVWKGPVNTKKASTPASLAWLGGLFGWLDQSARLLVWVTVAILATLLIYFIVRIVRIPDVRRREESFIAPTHVRDLDIRPESLPADIGAAARALWDRGDHRAALALLYRGLLSRLAHVHRMPIRDSTTEGDCLALAEKHLTPRKREYTSRLVGVWQRAVYGREDVQAATVYVLCEDFASMLNGGTPLDAQQAYLGVKPGRGTA